MKPVKVFISYSHKDQLLREKLNEHLASLEHAGFIRAWHDRRIVAGARWEDELDRELERAEIILLLVSPSFNASRYCYGREMRRALERHAAGNARVIPIILRPVVWMDQPYSKLQALPRDARPVTKWRNRDDALADVTNGIRTAILDLRRQNKDLADAATSADREVSSLLGASRQQLSLVEKIGQGAFGTVWRAWNMDLERWEAVKIYSSEFTRDKTKRARFVRGLRVQARLHHQGIGALYSFRSDDDRLEVSMYLSSGVTLDRWVAEQRPSISERLRLLAGVCEAVAYLHENNVVHRDLKPANILVERGKSAVHPIVVDFDAAVIVDADRLTRTAEILGTVGFIAPEVVKKGAPADASRAVAADIYSLGAVAFFTLFGDIPTGGDVNSRSLARRAVSLQELDEGRRQFLVNVLSKALNDDAFARYESAKELGEGLLLSVPGSELPDFDAELPFVLKVFEAFDQREAPRLLDLGFTNRRFDEYDQIGRYTRV